MARASFELPKTLTKGKLKINMNVVMMNDEDFWGGCQAHFSSGAKFSQLKAARFVYSKSET